MSVSNLRFIDLAPPGDVPLQDAAVLLHPADDVAIVKNGLQAGTTLLTGRGERVAVRGFIPRGHKVALRDLAAGQPVRRYNQIIGFTTTAVRVGEHLHNHNLHADDFEREYLFSTEAQLLEPVPPDQRLVFQGYVRQGGRTGTRNYIAVVATVNCSGHTVQEIARAFTSEQLAKYPNVDGVVALAHHSGCGNRVGGEGYLLLQRTLRGMMAHPNVGATVVVGLGCETNQIEELLGHDGDSRAEYNTSGREPRRLVIQERGGIRKTVEAGIAAIEEVLPVVNSDRRTARPISDLTLALQCGGSDGWSGVTANPVLGMVADEVVRQGGRVVLGETPEIYGAEHLLTRRAISREVGEQLIARVRWWEDHTRRQGIEIDNNPSPGNKAGGLTTIYEKSLGAVAKAGTSPLMAVYDYAETVTAPGFSFMDTPGYDPVSVTGQVAGGCNLVLFTTGRGSVFGFKPAPSIKICSNSATYERMQDDMDFNAGQVLEGIPIEQAKDCLLNLVLSVASGEPSKSEAQGVGEAEFNPWNLGGTL